MRDYITFLTCTHFSRFRRRAARSRPYVRLKAREVRGVKVPSRHTLSGL